MEIIDRSLAAEVVGKAMETGGEYADIFCQRRTVQSIQFEDSKLDDLTHGLDSGAGIRVIKGDLTVFAHTDILNREQLFLAAGNVAEALKYAGEGVRLITVPPGRSVPSGIQADDLETHEVATVISALAACDEVRSTSGSIKQVTVMHNAMNEESLFLDSDGAVHESRSHRTRLIVQVVAGRDGVIQVGQEAPGMLLGQEFYSEYDAYEVAQKAAARAVRMLDAKPSPTGRMAVVLNSGTGGVLLHEASGHGLESDCIQKGASVFANMIGEQVASTIVSASDNPTIPRLWGSYERDDEGTPSQKTPLIRDGVLAGFLYARHEAMKEGRASTGNGRRQSFRFPPIVRMSNTYFEPGESDPSEIISSTGSGLFAAKLGGGQVDPATGDYVFAVSEGYLIEKGRIGQPVRGATLIGNGPSTLKLIDAVGNDPGSEEGTCGKGGQGVPVTTGGPTFRIRELTVGGTEL